MHPPNLLKLNTIKVKKKTFHSDVYKVKLSSTHFFNQAQLQTPHQKHMMLMNNVVLSHHPQKQYCTACSIKLEIILIITKKIS